MPRELVLHIGISKTGTSSIQMSLDAARAQLAEAGVLVPLSPGKVNHGMLAMAFGPPSAWRGAHSRLWGGMDPARRLALFRTAFVEEMARMPPGIHRIVLSAEQLSHQLTQRSQIEALRDFLAPFADRVRVIVYLRRQDSHFASAQVQMLRSAAVVPPRLPVGTGLLNMSGLAPLYDYAALIGRWAEVFGEDAILPRIFEPGALVDGDAVEDFLVQIGTPGILPKDAPQRRRNQSVSPRGIALMLAMAAELRRQGSPLLSPQSVCWTRFAERVSELMPGRGWKPPAAEARAFLDRFAASNEAVRARWFPERASLFAEVEETDGDPLPGPPDDTTLDACRLLMAEIVRGARLDAERACEAARHAEQAGNEAKAVQQFQAALRADPDSAFAHAGLARLRAKSGDAAAAALHLDALRRVAPAHPQVERLERLLRRTERAVRDAARQPA